MAYPLATLTKANLDSSSDNPSLARAELEACIDRVNEMIPIFSFADVSQFGSFAAAVAAIGNTPKTLTYGSDQTLSADIAIPSTLELMPFNNAVINHTSYTISYAGSTVRWSSSQKFNGTGIVSGLNYVKPEWFGAVAGADSYTAFTKCIKAVSVSGGIIDGENKTYWIDTGGLLVNQNHTLFRNINFRRTSAQTGWILRFATTTDTIGGGVIDCSFTGDATVNASNGGVAFGSAGTWKANKFIAQNIRTDGLAQYGVGIWDGDNWTVKNINILNHGSTHASVPAAVGIGFFVFPQQASSGGQIDNVYSEINPLSTITASAAIKLQTHNKFTGNGFTAIGGTESSFVVDSIGGTISNVNVEPSDQNVGLNVGNYNAGHDFSGQTFILSDVFIKGDSLYGFVIGGGAVGQYKLTGCTISNIKGYSARYLGNSNVKNCVFTDWEFEAIQFDANALGFTVNALASTGNTYRNIIATGGTLPGYIQIEASNSTLVNCGTSPTDGSVTNAFNLKGDNNTLINPININSSTNALVIDGDNNTAINYYVYGAVGRSLWFKTGSTRNHVTSPNLNVGTGILDSGYNNWVLGKKRVVNNNVLNAAPKTDVWVAGERIINTSGAIGQPKAWQCTTAGGAYSATRANTTAYVIGEWIKWAAGTTVYECTQLLGLTNSTPPDITGKTVGQTVVDGAETWTLRSLVGYSTTRANSTNYTTGTLALWTTGTTVWECTTGGTTASSPPSVTGKIVGDTVTDGAAVWTLRATSGGVAYTTTRANSTNYQLETFARWTTGNTCWELTTVTGTSAGSEPSPGTVVGDTVTDGTVVWTLKSLTAAVFTSEGNL